MLLAIDVAAIVCAALLGARMAIGRPTSRAAVLIGLIALGVACDVVLARQEYGYWIAPDFRIAVGAWAAPLNLVRNLTPGLFMLLCFTLFTDRRRFPRPLLALWAVQVALEEPGRAVIPATAAYARLVTQTTPALLQALFVALALYWTLADWRADLIEGRRRTRMLTVLVAAVLTLASGLLTRVVIPPDSPANYAVHVGVTLADAAILSVVLLRLSGDDLARRLAFAPMPAPPPRPASGRDDAPALARLTALLETDQVWREEGLSLGDLARRVGAPEYRLRRLIHDRLGYRNFNALLHDHRVGEACRQLADPALAGTPILTIALSVGYASVNTFNRGFREITGQAPSAWRAAALSQAVENHPKS